MLKKYSAIQAWSSVSVMIGLKELLQGFRDIKLKNMETGLNSSAVTLDLQEKAVSSVGNEDKSKTVEIDDIKKLFKRKREPITE